jgi:alkanesulfonate monooxygenase SsuD/methylene tetrahydromethanopterin reductase-like flavin-dependent oxidoreductase (luciferase family)
VHFGLYLPTEGDFADVRLLMDLARTAEQAGWDGFFLWDALLPIHEHSDTVRAALGDSGHIIDAFVALTAIAASTKRLRFGAMVTPPSRLRPESFAKQMATLDQLSGGRLILGIGLGNPDSQFTAFGTEADLRTRAAMVDEFLEVVVQLWSGRPVDHAGVHYTARGVSMLPAPVQRPRIPIWIGADSRSRAPRRRAARWDGFIPASDSWPDGVITPTDYEAIVADIEALRPEGAASGFDVVVIGNAAGNLPETDALPAYAAAGVTWVLDQALSVEEARIRIGNGPPPYSP